MEIMLLSAETLNPVKAYGLKLPTTEVFIPVQHHQARWRSGEHQEQVVKSPVSNDERHM